MAEVGPAGFADHFSEAAGEYARFRPAYPPELVDWLADRVLGREPAVGPDPAGPPDIAPGVAWDAGCGSGQLSVALARRFGRVLATDASREQLARAAPHARVEYRMAVAGDSGLPPSSADLATAAQAAHWFDLDPYYAEVRRVVRPGGVVALVSYGSASTGSGVDAVLRRFHDDLLAPHWPPERRHVEDGYRSLPFPFREVEAPAFRMEADWTFARYIGYLGTWSSVRRLARTEGREALPGLRAELEGAWGDPERRRTVVWPLALRVGHV